MKLPTKIAASVLFGLASAAAIAPAASAAIVCNAEGDCWHAHRN